MNLTTTWQPADPCAVKSKISITLDSDIIEEIKLLAEEDDRSLSQYINIVIKDYLKIKKKTAFD
ncbi:MAG: ribbon-helix-helix protein, CopG family [Oscillospiraceae bacterium]|nr:ribbon-helix-helix protein, CopG family [Oscillospiraceae bacterium]